MADSEIETETAQETTNVQQPAIILASEGVELGSTDARTGVKSILKLSMTPTIPLPEDG